jgi:TolA-binding protein
MSFKLLVITVISALIMYGCGSMSSTNFKKKVLPGGKLSAVTKDNKQTAQKDTTGNQIKEKSFADTTVIDIVLKPEGVQNKGDQAAARFLEALSLFNDENYESSCDKFSQLADSFTKDDSLYYEVLFYRSECLIMDDKLDDSKKMLDEILKSKLKSEDLSQRAIVRLGQIYCRWDKKTDATKYFTRLKKEYPKSIYLPLANCEVVQNTKKK